MKISVIISVYANDSASLFERALLSVTTQSRVPDEVIIVVDGPVGDEISSVFTRYDSENEYIKIVRLRINSGHAVARQTGVNEAKSDWIAIMDSDDICVRERLAIQEKYLEKNPDVDFVGGQILEFFSAENIHDGSRLRKVPLFHREIENFSKQRCPMNLVTVMMRKSALESAGGFIDWYGQEDYFLWVRALNRGFVFANVPDILVRVDISNDMIRRRGGFKYLLSDLKFQRELYRMAFVSFNQYLTNSMIRLIVQVFVPIKVRQFIYQKYLRENG